MTTEIKRLQEEVERLKMLKLSERAIGAMGEMDRLRRLAEAKGSPAESRCKQARCVSCGSTSIMARLPSSAEHEGHCYRCHSQRSQRAGSLLASWQLLLNGVAS